MWGYFLTLASVGRQLLDRLNFSLLLLRMVTQGPQQASTSVLALAVKGKSNIYQTLRFFKGPQRKHDNFAVIPWSMHPLCAVPFLDYVDDYAVNTVTLQFYPHWDWKQVYLKQS